MKKEIWKDIPGYEGYYQASTFGNIKGLTKGKILSPCVGTHGYLGLALSVNGKRKSWRVHKLIAMTFLGHICCGMDEVVDHINDIQTDNRVDNLQCISPRLNVIKTPKGVSKYRGVSFDKRKGKWISLIFVNKKREYLGQFDSEIDASIAYESRLKEAIVLEKKLQAAKDRIKELENGKD